MLYTQCRHRVDTIVEPCRPVVGKRKGLCQIALRAVEIGTNCALWRKTYLDAMRHLCSQPLAMLSYTHFS